MIRIEKNKLLHGKHGRSFLADVFLPESAGEIPFVIFAHGFKGFKDWGVFDLVASQFAASGFGFIKFNFAFNGTTLENPLDFDDLDAFGNNNFTHELDDLEVAIDFLISNAEAFRVDINRIYLAGHSRGGGIVILKAAEDSRVRGVTSWAAVAGFARHITVQDIRYWRQAGVFYVENSRTGQQMPLYPQLYENYYRNRNRLNILKAAERLKVPFLIIHGDEDETVPVDHALELNKAASDSKLILLNKANHSFGAVHPYLSAELPHDFSSVVTHTISFFRAL